MVFTIRKIQLIFKKILNKFEGQTRNLEGLGVKMETFGNLLMPIILDRVPKDGGDLSMVFLSMDYYVLDSN